MAYWSRMIAGWLLAFAFLAAPQDLLSRGQKAFEAGDLAQAESLFREFLKAQPNSAEALSNLAAVNSRRGEFGEAIALYRRALKADPKLVQIHFNLGVALLRSGSCQTANDSFRTFLQSYPREMRARELLGLCLVETGQFRTAIDELEAVRREKPNDSSVIFSLAYAHARAGDPDRGAALMTQLEANPAQARVLEGLIDFRREHFQDARSKFEQALRHDPNYPPALAAMGRMYLHEGQDEQAIAFLEKALQLSPHDAESCYELGILYDRNQRAADARRTYNRAIELRSRFAGPLYGLAKMEMKENRPASAVKLLQRAAEYAPEAEAIQLLLGKAYQATGQAAKANAAFAEVRRIQQSRLKQQQDNLDSGLILDPEK